MERLICIVIGYACGLFQTAYILGKIYHIDIRKQGSGNLGSTNVLRTLGKKAGALNLLCDCLKCIAAILIVRAIFGNSYGDILPLLSLYAATGCILGHNFPFYLNFKGGKGVAASVGLVMLFFLSGSGLLCSDALMAWAATPPTARPSRRENRDFGLWPHPIPQPSWLWP